MEIKTLEELFIAKYEALEAENAELRDELAKREDENRALRDEVNKAKAFVSECMSVEKDACGKEGERKLSLGKIVSEWYAYGKDEKQKATEAIEYALSMGAKDEASMTRTNKAAEGE